MADKDAEKDTDKGKAKQAEGGEGKAEESAKKPLIPKPIARIAILGGILVVVVAGGLFLVTEVISPMLAGDPAEENETAAGEASTGDEETAPAAAGEIVQIGDFVVNPAGTGARRYIKVGVAVQVGDASVGTEIESKAPLFKDLIIREITARTVEELTDPVVKEEMRDSMVAELNQLMAGEPVTNLFFTEYVIQ